MTEEDVDRVVKDMKNRCDDIIEKNSSEEAAALLVRLNSFYSCINSDYKI